jgi:histidine phosphotransfer protein HptB
MNNICIKLKELGVDVDGTVTRLGGNELLYLAICQKFLQDQNFQLLQDALIKEDLKMTEIYIHTLKGVAANLGFIRLEQICRSMLEMVHQLNVLNIKQSYIELSEEYHKIISVLSN